MHWCWFALIDFFKSAKRTADLAQSNGDIFLMPEIRDWKRTYCIKFGFCSVWQFGSVRVRSVKQFGFVRFGSFRWKIWKIFVLFGFGSIPISTEIAANGAAMIAELSKHLYCLATYLWLTWTSVPAGIRRFFGINDQSSLLSVLFKFLWGRVQRFVLSWFLQQRYVVYEVHVNNCVFLISADDWVTTKLNSTGDRTRTCLGRVSRPTVEWWLSNFNPLWAH